MQPGEGGEGTDSEKVTKCVTAILNNLRGQMPATWQENMLPMDDLRAEAMKSEDATSKDAQLKALATMAAPSLLGVPENATPCGVENFGVPTVKLQDTRLKYFRWVSGGRIVVMADVTEMSRHFRTSSLSDLKQCLESIDPATMP
ncbi:unnamed protein product, partial [Symbiodinium pilosum]